MSDSDEDIMREIYYDPEKGYTGLAKFLVQLKKSGHNIAPKKVRKFLSQQEVVQGHAKQKKFPVQYRHIVTHHKNEVWQIDLINMHGKWIQVKNGKTYNGILTAIDAYSRRLFLRPITSKTASHVLSQFKDIIKEAGEAPDRIDCDGGKEFHGVFRQYLIENDIHYRTGVANIHRMQGLIERVHSTLQDMMIKHMRTRGSWNWINHVQQFARNYNNSKHSVIKCTPNEAWNGDVEPSTYPLVKEKARALKIGTHVRIHYDPIEGAGHTRIWDALWSDEVFTVAGIDRTPLPRLYYLTQMGTGEPVERPYYRWEMKVVSTIDKNTLTNDIIRPSRGWGR